MSEVQLNIKLPLSVNSKEACRLLGISKNQLYRLRKAKRLIATKVQARNLLFKYSDLVELLDNK
ncbi:MAG: helix-turn-helix domain-containing protein [Verrucomicrobiae bacterium]|nr:helix-turn-helix domain-containing protein [Verrucomicrobiae bacterium]